MRYEVLTWGCLCMPSQSCFRFNSLFKEKQITFYPSPFSLFLPLLFLCLFLSYYFLLLFSVSSYLPSPLSFICFHPLSVFLLHISCLLLLLPILRRRGKKKREGGDKKENCNRKKLISFPLLSSHLQRLLLN